MKQVVNYIFDIDGTLTPSRSTIDKEFGSWFYNFCKLNNVFLVTGSDKPKTIEQIGLEIYNSCKRVYNCSGNDVYLGYKNLYRSKWKLPTEAIKFLEDQLSIADYSERYGNHIEHRFGLCNFSVVGRNANKSQRKKYVEYDHVSNERHIIAKAFNERFKGLDANVAGDIGIDITLRGCDKSQILLDFNHNSAPIYFYGDKCQEGGNDYTISKAIEKRQDSSLVYEVKDWKETWQLLK